jgi:RNA polymerase-binding transcription factor DksA
VTGSDFPRLLQVVVAEEARTARQIAALEAVVAAIVEASELTSTDDEHDPEGATIAYERAQAIALLRQARADSDALVATRRQLVREQRVVCVGCGRDIDLERVAALPTTSRCVRCAA